MEESGNIQFLEGTLEKILEDLPAINCESGFFGKREVDLYTSWMQKCAKYNVGSGKQLRGQLLMKTFALMVPTASKEDLFLVRVLACVVEMLHAALLVADDIIDRGQTRWGRKCWYLQIEKEGIAVNDSFVMENLAYQILKKYFGHLKCYGQLLDEMMSVTYKTLLGQGMDTASETKHPSEFSESQYFAIVIYKTSYYTVYLSVALAMIYSGIDHSAEDTQDMWRKVRDICLELGYLYQAQDDVLNVFGDSGKTRKVSGSDIQAGKCTWLFVQAQRLSSAEQLRQIYDNYGQSDRAKIDAVEQIYEDLDLNQKFVVYEENQYQKIKEDILALNHASLEFALMTFLNSICSRES